MGDPHSDVDQLRWNDLSRDVREALSGKLSGLWGATSDEEALDALSVDKQQALFLILSRLQAKDLWHVIRKITNLYGEGGVGIEFSPWPVIESTLTGRKDFTRLLANHQDASGGFYEKGRAEASLHFLFVEENPRKWYVHFDLYSPVHSPVSAFKHIRHEFVGKTRPDWRLIHERLKA